MADGRKNNGGKRPGAGRKTKAEELGLDALINTAWPEDQQIKVLKKLASDCNSRDFHTRQESRKLLMAYKFGKPKERHEVTGKDGEALFPKVYAGFDPEKV